MSSGDDGKHADELTYGDLLRVGPDTIAGQYLRLFWHPVLDARELASGHVKPVRVLGEDVTLYRGDNGVVHAVADRCPHRGVRLVLGLVEGDDIRCAYHGWKYDASGRCVEQPAETRPFCERVRIRAYPTREYLGLVFAYLGEGEPPPLPRLADYEDDEAYVREITSDIWPCSYFDLLENATDIAHTEYLHWHFRFKTPDKLDWRESDWGMSGFFGDSNTKNAMFNRSYFHMPQSAEFTITGRMGTGFFTRAWRVPRDDNSALRFNLVALPRALVNEAAAPGLTPYGSLRGLKDDTGRRDGSEAERAANPAVEIAAGLLSGREDMRALKERSETMNHRYLTNIQDCAVLSSLGPPAERHFTEFFGRTDVSVALLRHLWLRELTALAHGQPLKAWRRPDFLWEDVIALHRAVGNDRSAAQ